RGPARSSRGVQRTRVAQWGAGAPAGGSTQDAGEGAGAPLSTTACCYPRDNSRMASPETRSTRKTQHSPSDFFTTSEPAKRGEGSVTDERILRRLRASE